MTAAVNVLCFCLTVLTWGCRFGHAPGDGLGEFPVVSADLDASVSSELAPNEPDPDPPASVGAAVVAAGARAPSTAPGRSAMAGAGAGGSTTPVDQSKPVAADSCSKRGTIEVCDPIANSGCPAELGMQCDVDLLATTLTGMCVWSSPPDPNGCLAIFPTQTCPPQSTCVEGSCLKICLCDSDCAAAERCMVPLGSSGFKACQAR